MLIRSISTSDKQYAPIEDPDATVGRMRQRHKASALHFRLEQAIGPRIRLSMTARRIEISDYLE